MDGILIVFWPYIHIDTFDVAELRRLIGYELLCLNAVGQAFIFIGITN